MPVHRDAFHQIPVVVKGVREVREPEAEMKRVFVVEGSTGEYSDHCEWPVAAYLDEEQAKLHVLKATERANELMAKENNRYQWGSKDHQQLNQWDRNMYIDYTGVKYRYYSVDLLDTVPPKGMPKIKGRTQ